MNNLLEAKKLVEQMEDEAQQGAFGSIDTAEPAGAGPDIGGDDVDMLPPSEPPISDTAIGADTEGDTALGLLTQMKDLLTVLVTAVAPESEVAPEAEVGGPPGEITGGEGEYGDMPPEPPVDAEVPTEGEPAEEGGGEGGEGESEKEEEDEEELPDRRPTE